MEHSLDTKSSALDEVGSFLSWTLALEKQQRSHPGIPVSRWFHGRKLRVYARVGPACVYLPKTPVVVLANIAVADAWQGQGLFTELVRRLDANAEIRAEATVVEKVANERLAAFLARCGFDAHRLSDLDFPTMTRPRSFRCRRNAVD